VRSSDSEIIIRKFIWPHAAKRRSDREAHPRTNSTPDERRQSRDYTSTSHRHHHGETALDFDDASRQEKEKRQNYDSKLQSTSPRPKKEEKK